MKILKYSEDRKTVFLAILTFVLHLMPYLLMHEFVLSGLNAMYFYVSFFLALSYFSYLCGGINHNHTHVPTFNSRILNRIFDILLSINMGRSTSYLAIPHNYNHHGHFATMEDWSDPRQIGKYKGFTGLTFYVFKIFYLMTRFQAKEATLKTRPKLMKRILIEQVFLTLFVGAFIVMDWRVFLLITLPSWLVEIYLLLAINFFQHGYCELDSKYNHSRNFTGRIYNFMFMNNGYHTYHHTYPKVHWSKLPQMHATHIDPFINPRFNQSDFFRYVFTDFLRQK